MINKVTPLWLLDQKYRRLYGMQLGGVDEAGRGPLAGNVVAACVMLDPKRKIEGLDDSKKLSSSKREFLFDQIQKKALCWGLGEGSVEEIDRYNILQATFLAMQRAIQTVEKTCNVIHYLLVDGNQRIPEIKIPQATLVKGDNRSASIAAASILAKVTRDRQMEQLNQEFPKYGFLAHKGYGTKKHIAAILKYGLTKHHRKSFRPKALAQTLLFTEVRGESE